MNSIRTKTGFSFLVVFLLGLLQVPHLGAESKVVEVAGYGRNRGEALRDAFRHAIETGLGLKISAQTEMERFRLVKDIVFKESQGFMEKYDILSEGSHSSMGYEVTIKAQVTKGKISEIDNLRTMIDLMGNPSIAVSVTEVEGGHAAGIDLVGQETAKALKRVGYNVIAPSSRQGGGLEDVLDIAAKAKADVLILGKIHSEITGRHGKPQFPLITSRSGFTAQVVVVETGELVFTVNSSEEKGTGNTEDASIKKAINAYIEGVCDGFLWEMAPEIGPPYNIEVSVLNMDCGAANSIREKMLSSADVELISLSGCRDNTGSFKARIACGTGEFAASLKDLLGSEAKVTGIGRGRVELKYQPH
jgi:hypothetical protein